MPSCPAHPRTAARQSGSASSNRPCSLSRLARFPAERSVSRWPSPSCARCPSRAARYSGSASSSLP
eukprot:3437034-Pyramimonas_sp.AAC.1